MAHWAQCRGHACLRNLPACTAWALGPERSEVTAAHTQWTSASLGHSSRGGFADQTHGTWRAGLLEQMLPLTAQLETGVSWSQKEVYDGRNDDHGTASHWRSTEYLSHAGQAQLWSPLGVCHLTGLRLSLILFRHQAPPPGCSLGTSRPAAWPTLSFWAFEGGPILWPATWVTPLSPPHPVLLEFSARSPVLYSGHLIPFSSLLASSCLLSTTFVSFMN